MVVRSESGGDGGGAAAVYTTTGPDQCVAFTKITPINSGWRRNWRFYLDPGGTQGSLMAQYGQCKMTEKFYSAPFVFAGVHYDIIVPPVVYSGQNFWITVVVVNVGGSTKTNYCGTTSFTSTDPVAQIEGSDMEPYNFTWSSATACTGSNEDGVKLFFNVTFTNLGMQSIVASDTQDGSITGIATLQVVGVDVKLFKEPQLTVAASGDTVQFKVCWSNYSTASAFAFTITDAVPEGTSYVPEAANLALCGATNAKVYGTDYDLAYSTSTSVTPPGTFTRISSPGASSPPPGTRWLRWSVQKVGVYTTGCLCYQVMVQ